MNKVDTFTLEDNSKIDMDNSGNIIPIDEFENTMDLGLIWLIHENSKLKATQN